MYYTAKFWVHPPPSRSSSSCTKKSPAVPGRPVWSRRGGLRRRFSGTPWSSSPTSFPWCRSWTLLGCWGRLGWWTSFGSSTRRRWTSWSSPCPSSISPGFRNAAHVVDRGRAADQLVEVPTIISYSSLQQRIAEQLIDIPVPHDRGRPGRWRRPSMVSRAGTGCNSVSWSRIR